MYIKVKLIVPYRKVRVCYKIVLTNSVLEEIACYIAK